MNARSWFAILNEDGDPVECDMETWSQWFSGGGQRILIQETIDRYKVSTVFIGCKQWFETIVFDPDGESIWQRNCDTRVEALASHEVAKRLIENGEIGTPGKESI